MKRILSALLAVLWGGIFTSSAFAQAFQADSQINVTSILVAANTTATVVTASKATLYEIEAFNNSTTIAYVKVYNAATATCGTGTPQARYMISSSANPQPLMVNINGDAYVNGITVCVVTGYADNNTSAPSASEYIVNLHWKAKEPF
jgi:NAD(P)H-dependent flavin oxidoreductase YrpB (nitropropane dioxygenase family)